MTAEQADKYKATLRNYLPEVAVEPVFLFLTQRHLVKLIITRDRHTKLGDYRWPQNGKNYHQITINGGLNPYRFLYVLLHEMAHLTTWTRHGLNVRAHGHEWQEVYAALLQQYLHAFPSEVQPLLLRYTMHIPLHNPTGTELEGRLHQYDDDSAPEWQLLRDLPMGSTFVLADTADSLVFQVLHKRRTRYLCRELDHGDPYTIPGAARVVVLHLNQQSTL